ncbi:unnamed protein product [Phaeothamnion confervicola]
MQALLQSIFGAGSTAQTLADVLAEAPPTGTATVRPRFTVREAARLMAETRKAVLVVEGGELVGILTPKDVLNRVVAKGLSPDTTSVETVMTPRPDSAPPDTAVLAALRTMQEGGYLHLPVMDTGGRVQGVVDAMEVIVVTLGDNGSGAWEAFFGDDDDTSSADGGDDGSASEQSMAQSSFRLPPASARGGGAAGSLLGLARSGGGSGGSRVGRRAGGDGPGSVASGGCRASATNGGRLPASAAARRPSRAVEADAVAAAEVDQQDAPSGSDSPSQRGTIMDSDLDVQFVYKVADADGHVHRLRCSAERLAPLLRAVAEKVLGADADPTAVLLRYRDEEGDDVVLSGDAALADAVDMARGAGAQVLKLTTVLVKPAADASGGTAGGGADAVGSAAAGAPAGAAGGTSGATEGSAAAAVGTCAAAAGLGRGTGDKTVIIAGVAAAMAVLAVAAIALSRGRR